MARTTDSTHHDSADDSNRDEGVGRDATDDFREVDADFSPDDDQQATARIADDLQRLTSFNWLAAARIQLEQGRHHDAEIDQLLRRVFGFSTGQFSGPYIVRLLVSLSLVFAVCTIFWLILWNLLALLGWTDFMRLASTWGVTIMVFLFGVVLSQPRTLIDEHTLEQAGKARIEQLQAILRQTSATQPATPDTSEAPDTPKASEAATASAAAAASDTTAVSETSTASAAPVPSSSTSSSTSSSGAAASTSEATAPTSGSTTPDNAIPPATATTTITTTATTPNADATATGQAIDTLQPR